MGRRPARATTSTLIYSAAKWRREGWAISDLKGKVKTSGRESTEEPVARADLFCPICQTVSRHEFLNPEDPTRVRCLKCGATRDLNAWEPEESEINLAGYSPSDEDET